MIIIGIDPGLDGAIAFLDQHGAKVFELPTVPLPSGSVTRRVNGRALGRLIRDNCPAGHAVLAVIEDLSAGGLRARPGEKTGSSAQTVGSQYRTRGAIECCLEMLGLNVEPVHALKWKHFYGLDSKKEAARQKALVLFPGVAEQLRLAKHHNRAEALLIANWGRKVLA